MSEPVNAIVARIMEVIDDEIRSPMELQMAKDVLERVETEVRCRQDGIRDDMICQGISE